MCLVHAWNSRSCTSVRAQCRHAEHPKFPPPAVDTVACTPLNKCRLDWRVSDQSFTDDTILRHALPPSEHSQSYVDYRPQVGLLKLGVTIVDACPEAGFPLGEGLVEALLDDFLFAPPTPASTASESMAPTRPKCKTAASRAMAYRLLAALCRPRAVGGKDAFDPSRNLKLLLEKGFIPLRDLLHKPDVWGYR